MTPDSQAVYEIHDAMDYEDVSGACKHCGIKKTHTDRRQCVEDLLKAVPARRLPETITYLREQIADTSWSHRR